MGTKVRSKSVRASNGTGSSLLVKLELTRSIDSSTRALHTPLLKKLVTARAAKANAEAEIKVGCGGNKPRNARL